MALVRVAAGVSVCLMMSGWCVAPAEAAAPNVTFTASGTFSSALISGNDELKLAGQPFTISVIVNAASVPVKKGPNWAVFSPLKMTGTVHSGLVGQTPVNIASGAASIEQAVGPDFDQITLAFPVKVVGISLTIVAKIDVPPGTIANQLIHPFAAVPLSAASSSVTYAQGSSSTTLAVQKGTLVAAIPKAAR